MIRLNAFFIRNYGLLAFWSCNLLGWQFNPIYMFQTFKISRQDHWNFQS